MPLLKRLYGPGALALAVCLGGAAPMPSKAQAESLRGAVREIERQVIMPEGARPLSAYDRYYTRTRLAGRAVIQGVFLSRSQGPHGGVALEEHVYVVAGAGALPVISDGGCGIVTIYFDLKTQRLARIREDGEETKRLAVCNGYG